DIAKSAKDLMPAGKQREQMEQKLQEAEEASKLARAQSANALGHVLCKRHFPPGIMVKVGREGDNQWQCTECHHKKPSDQELQEEASYDPFTS
ncbi:MAG: hypothetical protein MN733_39920, partial [Nitrososphaera sp.]|nr:hypothetical protein [Nitrososphaera sp.]